MNFTSNQTVLSTKHPRLHSTSSSSATATNTTADSAYLASLFECPVCFDYILPPISQCKNGHLICSNCRPKMTRCPTCRARLGNIRCLGMEKVASTVMFPCKHSTYGCAVALLHTEKRKHEETCEFRPYSCPFPGSSCTWQGSLQQVVPHLMKSHESIPTIEREDILCSVPSINLSGTVDWGIIQSCFGHHFMVLVMKREMPNGHHLFFAIVQLIGSRKQAENFEYKLELNGHGLRFIWETTLTAIHEGGYSGIKNPECLIFDTQFAQFFADNGYLNINVRISMV
ncbi:E3 ubiquitin-protein ligase SIAH1 [Cryptotermes secundus]|uniref:E3 ubiquitin-protein ligase n=1 Tax=Cryptotermes secundus TaxID=105785 RepID=A0A2J7QDI7_9NEOP|nr:E3 ubiquitin-protein ligase SIAH1 [Cryptotermes secundus]